MRDELAYVASKNYLVYRFRLTGELFLGSEINNHTENADITYTSGHLN